MSNELIAVMTASVGGNLIIIGLGWRMYALLRRDLENVKERLGSVEQRLAHIEGWIQGRFREGEVTP